MPLIEAVHRAFGSAINVWAIGQEDNAALIKHHKARVPMLDDMVLKVSFANKIEIVPTVILSDASGVEVMRGYFGSNKAETHRWPQAEPLTLSRFEHSIALDFCTGIHVLKIRSLDFLLGIGLHTGPMTRRTMHHVVTEAAKAAAIEFPVHPHMLRHATGFYLANAGQDTRAIQMYLGHKNIQHTVRYTELSSGRFRSCLKSL